MKCHHCLDEVCRSCEVRALKLKIEDLERALEASEAMRDAVDQRRAKLALLLGAAVRECGFGDNVIGWCRHMGLPV